MHRNYMRRIMGKSLLFAIVSLFGAGWMFVEYISQLPKPGDQLVEGHIVKIAVKETPVHTNGEDYVGRESLLTIDIVNTNTTVTALMPGDWTNKPAFVKFYYSGDPNQRVSLQPPDTNLLLTALFFLLMALLLFLPVIIIRMIEKSEKDFRHNQYETLLKKIR